MAVFEKVVHGNLKDVIQNTDMLLKEGKHKLDFRDEYSMTSKGMDVTADAIIRDIRAASLLQAIAYFPTTCSKRASFSPYLIVSSLQTPK